MCEKIYITLVALRVSLLALPPHKKHLSWNPGNGEAMAQNGLMQHSSSGGGGGGSGGNSSSSSSS